MKKQIDLSELYSFLGSYQKSDKGEYCLEDKKKALVIHFLMNPTGNQYYPLCRA